MSEREPAGGGAEFSSLMLALRDLKSGPLSDHPSDQALAEAAGVSPTTIGDWLRGRLVYLTDVRGERVVIIQANWIS
jgi:hypothetical protein